LADQTEIHHGCDLLSDEIRKIIAIGVSPFEQIVLSKLPDHVRVRINRTFVACFCAYPNSLYHWRLSKHWGYGDFCLKIPSTTANQPHLRPSCGDAYLQYHRVIYGQIKQRRAISQALASVRNALDRYSRGTAEGPWIQGLGDFVARNAAELLLDLIVSFKRRRYALDREWRLVVRPNSALCSSAPDIADANFDVMVKRASKRYVELFVKVEYSPFRPMLRPPIPFSGIIRSPFLRERVTQAEIQSALDEHDRQDIHVTRVGWLG
jgi:hypothetical protein